MMTLMRVVLVAAALVVPLGYAQTPPDKASEAKKPNAVPDPVIAPFCVGTVFNAMLLTPLDAARNKAGDPVTAEITETVTYERSVIFPRGTKVYGHLVRASSTRSGKGSALFVRFDKATLKSGQEVMMNAGIQALVTGRKAASGDALAASETQRYQRNDYGSRNVPAPAVIPASQELQPRTAGPESGLQPAQGSVSKNGMITPDSQGALGSPNIKVYTPLSEGSDGTVLLSDGKTMRLDAGTKLLLVVQPPPESDPSLQ